MSTQDGNKFQSVKECVNDKQSLNLPAENFKSNFEIRMLSSQNSNQQLNIAIFAISFDNLAQQEYEKKLIIQENKTLKARIDDLELKAKEKEAQQQKLSKEVKMKEIKQSIGM